MIELAAMFVAGLAVMLVPLRQLNVRRMVAWSARDAARLEGENAVQGKRFIIQELVSNHEVLVSRDAAMAREATKRDTAAHDLAVVALKSVHGAVVSSLEHTQAKLQGQIIGMESAHVVDKRWADSILRNHDWRIGGKADVHGLGPLVRYECVCTAVTFAEKGSL